MARSLPTSAFSRLLLPTLGRPTMATARGRSWFSTASADFGGGNVVINWSSISPVPVPLIADTAMGSRPVFQNSAACARYQYIL